MNKRKLYEKRGFVNASSSIIAIVVGLVLGYIILLISNPEQASKGMLTILEGGFGGGAKGVGQVFYFATPIIMTGLSVGFAFKTGLFNIGASGQFIVGAFAAVYIGVEWTFLPGALHWIVALIGAAVAGGLWALIPGLLKAYRNVNEVISSIMMNYVGMYGVNFLVKKLIYDSRTNLSLNVAETAVLPKAGLDEIFHNVVGSNQVKDPSTVNIGIIIAIAAAVLIYILLNKTTFGYELKACGYNRFASRYAGINEKKNIVLSMVIAGMLSGLGGGLMYLSGASGRRIKPIDVLAAEGFNGIPVALLGLSNPIGVVFSGLFVSFITQGGNYLQRLNYMPEIIDIIIASIIYCSALSLVFRSFVVRILKGKKKSVKVTETDEKQVGVTGAGILPPDVEPPDTAAIESELPDETPDETTDDAPDSESTEPPLESETGKEDKPNG